MCLGKKTSRRDPVIHQSESPRCFQVKRVGSAFSFPYLLLFLNLKHPVMSRQYNSDDMHTLESSEVFLKRRRTNENHVLGVFCQLMNCPSHLLYVRSVSVLYNLHFIDREHAVPVKMIQRHEDLRPEFF